MQSQPVARPARLPSASGLDRRGGVQFARHHFSSKLMMTVSTELRRRPRFVLKDTQPLRGARLPRAWWAGAVCVRCSLGLDSPGVEVTARGAAGLSLQLAGSSPGPV